MRARGAARERSIARTMRMLSRGNTIEACRSLLAAKQRSILALIGIAVGVAAVSAMMSVGLVVKTRALEQFRELGTEVMTIRVRNEKSAHGRVNLTLEEAANVTSTPAVLSAAPYTTSSRPLILSATTLSKGTVIGATGEFAELGRLRLRAGRFVSVLDGTQYFCTIGSDIAEALGGAAAIGRTVRIGDAIHEVIGVLERVGGSQRAVDVNGSVFVSVEDASRVTPNATLRNIVVMRDADTDYREAARQIEAYFRGDPPAGESVGAKPGRADRGHAAPDAALHPAARIGQRHRVARRRDRGDEHHARGSGGAKNGDRGAPRARRAQARRKRSDPGRIAHPLARGWGGRGRDRSRRNLGDLQLQRLGVPGVDAVIRARAQRRVRHGSAVRAVPARQAANMEPVEALRAV